jgi:hypothetical protein
MTKINTKSKKGYKNTEVGIIPEDWEVKTCNVCPLWRYSYKMEFLFGF